MLKKSGDYIGETKTGMTLIMPEAPASSRCHHMCLSIHSPGWVILSLMGISVICAITFAMPFRCGLTHIGMPVTNIQEAGYHRALSVPSPGTLVLNNNGRFLIGQRPIHLEVQL